MNFPSKLPTPYDRLRFILVETSHPGNVGAVARAMKTMGFSQLFLVNPRYPDVTTHPEAIAMASGAQDILDGAQRVDSVAQALEGCGVAAAVSARLREFSPPIVDPREFALRLLMPIPADHDAQTDIALILGNERTGLPNALVEKCNYLINIPANPAYSSLNLAQAVQVLAYECRVAITEENRLRPPEIGFKGGSASVSDIDGMFAHVEQALIAIEFLDPESPKRLMSRLKRLFARTQLESEEVNIFRGIAKKIMDKNKGTK